MRTKSFLQWLSSMVGVILILLTGVQPASGQANESIAARSKKAGSKLSIALVSIDQSHAWTKPVMTASFEDALLKAGRFKVLSRSELDAVMGEQHLSTTGMIDPASAVKLGKAMAANYVLVVKQLTIDAKQGMNAAATIFGIGKKTTTYTLNLQAQVLDTESTELVQSESFTKTIELSAKIMGSQQTEQDPSITGPYKAALDEFATSFTTKLAATLPLEALVVMVRDAKNIALNVGMDLGLRPGSLFELVEEGEPIKGPGGEVLGYDSHVVGLVKVVRVEAKLTWTELVKTVGRDGTEDAMPDVAKVKQYLVAKMVAAK